MMIPLIRRRRGAGSLKRKLRALVIAVALLGFIPLIVMRKGGEFGMMQWVLFSAAAIVVLGALFFVLRSRAEEDEEHSRTTGKPID